MKTLLCAAFFAATFLPGMMAVSQNLTRQPGCANASILLQADSMKQLFSNQGFIVVKEASIKMESEFEMPVIVPLIESVLYQFIFIGDASSRLYEVRMFDWDEKQVAYQKKELGDMDVNVISLAYTPRISEYHMMKPVQVNNDKKNLCGYVLLLKKVSQ
ncbi:MAG: hypothetical protein WKI04_01610 [Ferruginibacter sp.]